MSIELKGRTLEAQPGETPDTAQLASYLLQNFAPRTACIVDCGDGSLVWALKQRGVDAVGIGDSSSIPHRVRVWSRIPDAPCVEDFDLVVVCRELVSWTSIKNLVCPNTKVLQLFDGSLGWIRT